jgi:hypothetical protein
MNTDARCPATVPAVARRGRKGLGDPAFRACSITDRAAWDGRTGGDAQG